MPNFICRTYDSKQWLLLPETLIINAYYAAIEKAGFPTIDVCVVPFIILHVKLMSIVGYRTNVISTPSSHTQRCWKYQFINKSFHHLSNLCGPLHATSFIPHPYHDFPTIVSHVHPRFVICNSGSKLEADVFKWQMQYKAHQDDLAKVQAIWNSWRMAIPKG